VEYQDYLAQLQASHPDLHREIASIRGLGGVMDWLKHRGISLAEIEIINQDEFSLDFIIPLRRSGSSLVFGIT
jgi:hypothetical protein